MEADQQTLSLQTWATHTLSSQCAAQGAGQHYPIEKAGVWVDCVRERKPVVHNDCAGLAHKKGLPDGHAPIVRELVVPVVRNEKIVAILGVGNKATDYTASDVDIVEQFANLSWETIRSKHAEAAQRRSEAKFRSLYTAMSESMALHRLLYDAAGKAVDYVVEDIDPAYETILGMRADEVLMRRASRLYDGDHAPYLDVYAEVVKSGMPARFEAYYEPAGKHFNIKVFSPAADQFVTVFEDITERRQAEAKLRRSEARLQAIIASNANPIVACDDNNMLSVIIGNAEMAADGLSADDPLCDPLKEILNAATRSAETTRQLLAFARKQTIAPNVLDMNAIVEGMLKMLRRLIGEDVELVWQPGAQMWPVRMDPAQIDPILANLCVNARDAIADVGRIVIRTDTVSLDRTYCEDHIGGIPGDYVMLAVSDDGHGMDKETQSQLFEPFFTTKGVGKGTELWLSTVYGIVKQNAGFVSVTSEPAQGTTFEIYLPRHERAGVHAGSEPSAAMDVRGSETILLVEDEPAILKLTRRILERLGYTADVITHHGVLDDGVQFIQKPFSREVLARSVRDVLDGKP